MPYYLYLRFVILTAGTLLPFFWMVVILGHRRQRNFERIFFFLCLALVFVFGASLLALNAQLYYLAVAPALSFFAWAVLCVGLWSLPSLLLHLHVEYADIRNLLPSRGAKRFWLAVAYLPSLLVLPRLATAVTSSNIHKDFLLPANSLGWAFVAWLVAAIALSAAWQRRFQKAAPDREQASFHRSLFHSLWFMAVAVAVIHFATLRGWNMGGSAGATVYITLVAAIAVFPLFLLIRNVQRFNFLQIGRQQNLIYAVFATFIALLYLALVRRASLWLGPYLPPEASAALLLFLPVVFFEPLQRLIRKSLRQTAHSEMDRAQRIMAPVQEAARLGDVEKLVRFAEQWFAEQLQLEDVKLFVAKPETPAQQPARILGEEQFSIMQGGRRIGTLRAKPHGAMLSGETVAALEFLCDQLPGAIDLCRLIEEKVRLERELAERERLALVGQMTASISHNLKNPLGSIKTILQVQLENSGLPDTIRRETQIVLGEIGRLSATLNQLLKFSRPAVLRSGISASSDARGIIEEVSAVLRHEAEKHGVKLHIDLPAAAPKLAVTPEAVNDIVSNLVVNALEAAPSGGHVTVSSAFNGASYVLRIQDDGPGVPASVRDKILEPFFTTKTQGTGLGLAIVARRVAECGGSLNWHSPVQDGRGTRFDVTLPLAGPTPAAPPDPVPALESALEKENKS